MCSVGVVDKDGTSLDHHYEISGGVLYALEGAPEDEPSLEEQVVPFNETPLADGLIQLDPQPHTNIDVALGIVFAKHGLPVLGGSSGIRGWSSIAAFQRCPFLWRQTYGRKSAEGPGPFALETGSAVHAALAVFYARIMNPGYPLEPLPLLDALRDLNVDPEVIAEAYRLVVAYFSKYENDWMIPIAVEHRISDPKTGNSCRWDLVVHVPESPMPGILPGTYTCDHKTSSRFDQGALDGWRNDGSVLQQLDLYDRLKVEKRFGKLQGHLINLIGKQVKPRFERIFVPPLPATIRDHRKSLRIWGATIGLANEMNHFPRARGNCIHRYGKCALYDHCSGFSTASVVVKDAA
jgi:hypothetical protein